jgi:hypothetical protein
LCFSGKLNTTEHLDSGITVFAKVEISSEFVSNNTSSSVEVWVGTVDGTIAIWNSKGTFQRKFKYETTESNPIFREGR